MNATRVALFLPVAGALLVAACARSPVPAPVGGIAGVVTVDGGDLTGVIVAIPGTVSSPRSDGSFGFAALTSATYRVSATKEGFVTASADVVVTTGLVARATLALHKTPLPADLPTLTSFSVSPPVLARGEHGQLLAAATDPAGGALTYVFTAGSGWTITPGDPGTATLIAPDQSDATTTVKVTATNATGGAATGSLLVSTTQNQAPILSGLVASPPLLARGGTSTLTAVASDPDGDALTYAWTAPVGWTLSGAGAQVTLTAPNQYGQTATVSLAVRDGGGATASGLVVVSTRENQPPQIASVVATPPVLSKGGTASVGVLALDPDGDALTYSWTVPAGWTLSGSGSSVSVTAPNLPGQAATIGVDATDGLATTHAVVVVSTLANRAPEISSLVATPTQLPPGGQTAVQVFASDPDGDPLTYTWAVPSGWSIAGVGSSILVTAPNLPSQTATIAVDVSDGLAIVHAAVTVSTLANQPPQISSLVATPSLLARGGQATVQASASDPLGKPLTYAWTAPAGWTASGSGSAIIVTAPKLPGQAATVTVDVSNGTSTAQAAVAVSTLANRAPLITGVAGPSAPLLPGGQTSVNVTAVDEDGDAITFTYASSNAAWGLNANEAAAVLQAPLSNNTSTTLTVTASDPFGGQAISTLTVGTSACAAGYMNCDGAASNGCETALFNDASNCGACGAACPSGQDCNAGACVTDLVWSDEFSGAANTSPDPAKWGFDTGGNGWGNGELETYTSRPQNVRLDGSGHLIIQSIAETSTGADGNTRQYTSGRIKTQGLFSHAYGRVEAMIQIPFSQGVWPAFWMLGDNIGTVTWPTCGEIDVMENLGREPSIVHGTVHGPGYSGNNGLSGSYTATSGPLSTDFHLFAVEWEPNVIRWYVDGALYETRTLADLPNGAAWAYNHPFFILLNSAVGGGWPGNPDSTSVFPQTMLVDYVRVYSLLNTPYSGAPVALPGTVQAVNYDNGGEGVGYHDVDAVNHGGVLRREEGVDIESSVGGGADVGWTAPAEWLRYTVDAQRTGSYQVTAKVASNGAGGTFHLEIDGQNVSGTLSVPDTGGWQSWQSISMPPIPVVAGVHVLGLVMDGNGATTNGVGNFSSLTFGL
jgi:beta-glucanase (GH16 family)